MTVNAAGASSALPTATPSGAASFADTFDTFLTLLTTQLKYQDPLSPMDTTEFTNQLTQFSQVEQAIKTNAELERLIGMSQTNQAVAALAYIGRTIEAESGSIQLEDGSTKILYSLPDGVAATNVVVKDSSGAVVRSFQGEITPGRHELVWDGTNGSGVQQPDGAYTLEIQAVDAQGNTVTDTLFGFAGVVDQVISEGGPIYLMIGEVAVPLDRVAAVRAPS